MAHLKKCPLNILQERNYANGGSQCVVTNEENRQGEEVEVKKREREVCEGLEEEYAQEYRKKSEHLEPTQIEN